MHDELTARLADVPSNLDASDLPSLMAFFAGAPSTGAGAHDNLACAIGERGREFVDRHWRREDIQAWIWRVLLEYRRVYAEEPGSMDYVA
jgi:beta-1,2-xylosyltransferase